MCVCERELARSVAAHLRWNVDPVDETAVLGVKVDLIAALQVGQAHKAAHGQILAAVGPIDLHT